MPTLAPTGSPCPAIRDRGRAAGLPAGMCESPGRERDVAGATRQWVRGAWRAIVGCALLALATPATALDPERAIQQYTHAWYREQLPQNTVLAIVQRRDGSMWFATYAGVARHSGAEFRVVDKRNASALQSAAITALLEDDAGTLWIATLNGGLYRIRGAGTTVEPVPLSPEVESVFAIAQDSGGSMWFGTNAGVVRRDARGLRRFGEADGIARVPIRAMTADDNGGIWVALDGAGVAHFRDGVPELLGLEEGLPDLGVFDVQADRDGVIWAGTQAGLRRFRDGRFAQVPAAAALEGKRIYTLLGDRDGNLWATADGLGLCRLNARGFHCDQEIEGLSHDVVRSMVEDREGNLWIGATTSGVHRISDSKLATAIGKLDSNSIRAVHEDAAGTIWAGTDGAGLAIVHNGELVPYGYNTRLPSTFIRALTGDAQGNLWAGSIVGVSRIEPDGRVTSWKKSSGLPGAIVFAIVPDRAGGFWMGTSGGLARLQDGRLERIAVAGPNDIRSLQLDRGGRLWIGQRSGLQCLLDGRIDRCGTDGLPNTSVFAFHEAGNAMWLGTSKGLMRIQAGTLSRYTERDGLLDDDVFTLLDDGAGHFWTSSNRGISRLALSDILAFDQRRLPALRPRLFGKNDGMRTNQANGASQSPGLRARDGRLWVATAHGVVTVDPAKLAGNALPPLVAVERVVVDAAETARAALDRIGPGVEKLEFHYAAMSYVSPEAIRYRYRLDGFDRDWVEAGPRRAAYYTNLRPGRYAFRVTAANNDGIWNEAGDTLGFSILPRFHETGWFRSLLLLALVAAIVAVYRVRVWRLRDNERELTRVVGERTNELRDANAALTRLASLDGLTRIANRSAFDEALLRMWEDHRARAAPMAFLLCDIDAFKNYNDTYGHQAGDGALIRVAAALQSQARAGIDVAARYGGEEFAVLLGDHGMDDALAVAERLLDAVRQLDIPHLTSSAASRITLSIGVTSLVPDAVTSPVQAIWAADQALYRAKATGRDRLMGASPLAHAPIY